MANTLTWSPLGPRKSVAFFDPLNPGVVFKPQNNPETEIVSPNSVRKYLPTTNGTSVIVGDREYPPKEIALTWTYLDAADLEGLRPYIATSPIVFVDNNDQGYLGVLIFDQVQQLPGKTFLIYTVKASFLVLGPYNGLLTNINSLTPPSMTTALASGGYIPNATTLYFWQTVFTPWGESAVSSASTVTTSSANQRITLSWTAPVNSWYRKSRIYWNTTASASTATLLTEVLAGWTPSFIAYSNYFAYSTVVPPSYTTAFTGYFGAGKWLQQ
jgi:hypothetical protein